MTTILELVTSRLDDYQREPQLEFIVLGTGEAVDATPRREVERVVALVQHYGCAAFIYAGESIITVENADACIIPAELARELIKEGRLKWSLYTSATVPTR